MGVSGKGNGEMRARAPMSWRGRCGSMQTRTGVLAWKGEGGGRLAPADTHTVGNANGDRRSHPIRPPVDKHGGGA